MKHSQEFSPYNFDKENLTTLLPLTTVLSIVSHGLGNKTGSFVQKIT